MSTDRITRFTLERYLAGDLDDATKARVEAEVEKDTALRALLETLRRDQEAFASEVPYAAFRIEHEKRMASRQKKSAPLRLWLPSLAAAFGAAAMLVFSVGPEPRSGEDTLAPPPVERSKGSDVALSATVAIPGATPRHGVAGEVVPAGTRVQLAYEAGRNTHMAVFGVDASGAVSLYHPADGAALAPLPAGESGTLPFALTLDATPGAERFIAVFAMTAEPVASIRDRLARSAPLPAGVSQANFWLQRK